jgi:hypothetical protein
MEMASGALPSLQGTGTETSVPWNLSSMAVALWNCSGKNANSLRVFHREATYRWRGVIRRQSRWPHNRWARPGAGPRHPIVWAAPSPPPALVRSSILFREK